MDGVSPGRPQSFRYQRRSVDYDHIMTAAQEEGERRNTAEQGAERFMAKSIAAKKVRGGLRHAVVCSDVAGRIKERIAQSKRARAGSLAAVDESQVRRTCILRAFLFCLSFAFLRRYVFF